MSRRIGFTLVELLVVIALIVIIASISAQALPRILQADRVAQGANSLQGWLLECRQRAMRDQTPTGIRLIGASDPLGTPSLVQQVRMVQIPIEPFAVPGSAVTVTSGPGGSLDVSVDSGVDFSGGMTTATPQEDWPVQAGDFLVINTVPHKITGVDSTSTLLISETGTGTVPLQTKITNWYVNRAPHYVTGETYRYLPSSTTIDIGLTQLYGAMLTSGTTNGAWDIVFSPGGYLVVGNNGSQGRLLLWVRELGATQQGNTFSGNHAIVQVRSNGSIAVDGLNQQQSGGSYSDPFSFTRDPRGSGF